MTTSDQEAPRFSPALRGYDRVQVDEYLAQTSEYIVDLEDRVATAESALTECRRELASPGDAGVSQRLAAILELANEEADEIRARARADGQAMTLDAVAEAERTVTVAGERRDVIQQEIDDLTELRDVLLARLVDLGDEIRDAGARFQGYAPGAVPTVHADVELFDAEAIDEVAVVEEVAVVDDAPEADPWDDDVRGDEAPDEEPPTEPGPESDADALTVSGRTPEPS